MSEESSQKPPTSFYLISGVALLWNLVGVSVYISQVTISVDALAALTEVQRAYYETIPAWATAAFAIAVNGGALGCLLLLFRNTLALPVLILSLVGVLVKDVYDFIVFDVLGTMGPSVLSLAIPILVIGIYLVWFANDAKKKGWIG